ncbi:hypothetical protein GCM10025868_32190 [Angustibacter aerolatus]|uniref:mannan endo-1,4-beta-mannosidase n=1 Tax=Angustibacter aerolatus TaxID=1162965 RepID=A0ABQ6JKS8_9ACTN|nr:hypothetical protein [Angustibacter aerolatus]GMA87969.1 hypothetical protein GCM10025868_32190 [Angustibacter aerolatus]
MAALVVSGAVTAVAQTGPTTSGVLPQATTAAAATASTFVKRSGRVLQINGSTFRFSGSNMYWLALDDNVRDAAGPTYPSRRSIDDAMATAAASGGTVVRAWAGTVGCARCIEPRLGEFNQAGFTGLDYAVASARRNGQRLVLSLVDNWAYYHGSKTTFTGWRGRPESAFFSDPQVIADYQAYVTHVLTHVNPWTGLAYRDDPTIMAWETGNEMWCQTCSGNFWDGSWTRKAADHVKAVAPKQLVVDGHATDPNCVTACLHVPSLDIASVDLVDDHFYPLRAARVRTSSATAAAHGKGYLVGEYDWVNENGGDALPTFLSAVESNPVNGDLLWALIPHADGGGFANHDDGFQPVLPGPHARPGAAVAVARRARRHDVGPRRSAVLALAPAQPTLSAATRTGGGVGLVWSGVAGALAYEVQRSDVASGWTTWTTVAAAVDDHRVIDGPTWTDVSAAATSTTTLPTYRVRARSLGGVVGQWSAPLLAAPQGS